MNEQPGGEIILYQSGDAPAIDVRLDGDTVWLSLNQIADLLGRDKSNISRHIANVFAEGELERNSVVAEFATTAADDKTYGTDAAQDKLASDQYPRLSVDEIKTLVVDDKWLAMLAIAVQGELDRVSQTLTSRTHPATRQAWPDPRTSRRPAARALYL